MVGDTPLPALEHPAVKSATAIVRRKLDISHPKLYEVSPWQQPRRGILILEWEWRGPYDATGIKECSTLCEGVGTRFVSTGASGRTSFRFFTARELLSFDGNH